MNDDPQWWERHDAARRLNKWQRKARAAASRRNWLATCWHCGAEIAVDDDGYAECGCGMSQIVSRDKMRRCE